MRTLQEMPLLFGNGRLGKENMGSLQANFESVEVVYSKVLLYREPG